MDYNLYADNGYLDDPFEQVPGFEVIEYPSKTFKIDFENNCIDGVIDEKEALKQSVYMILNTERYKNLIFSWNYGAEIKDLIGKPISFVIPELDRRITEALTQDDRILDVGGFEFTKGRRSLHVKFTVYSKFGEMEIEKEVPA
jgi:hypothetical protein